MMTHTRRTKVTSWFGWWYSLKRGHSEVLTDCIISLFPHQPARMYLGWKQSSTNKKGSLILWLLLSDTTSEHRCCPWGLLQPSHHSYKIPSCLSIRHVHMAWEGSSRGDTTWAWAKLRADSKSVPKHIILGMYLSAQEARTGPMSQQNSLHAHAPRNYMCWTLETANVEKTILFFFPPGWFPVGVSISWW